MHADYMIASHKDLTMAAVLNQMKGEGFERKKLENFNSDKKRPIVFVAISSIYPLRVALPNMQSDVDN
jgi:hypothetical protein